MSTTGFVAPGVQIRTLRRAVEVAWFAALCADDYEFLGIPDGRLRSCFAHCSEIVRHADVLGYQNILLPSGWAVGQDALTFAAAMSVPTQQINQLVALRMGEVWPPMLARAIATLDHMARGRLTLNIISSDWPGTRESNDDRYERSSEIIQILQKLWAEDSLEWHGRFYDFSLPTTEPAKPYQQHGGPLLYFGGISPAAQELCAKHCDVLGMRAFILSGYPHLDECDLFARYVLPRLPKCRLNVEQQRLPADEPVTPLTTGIRR